MGHEVEYFDFPENEDKEVISKELTYFVSNNGFEKENYIRIDRIRWLDSPPLESYGEACKFIEENDRGWYDCLAVRFKEPNRETQKNIDVLWNLRQKRDKLERALKFLPLNPDYISCPSCASRLSRIHLVRLGTPNTCPLCETDLFPIKNEAAIKKHELADIDKEIQNLETDIDACLKDPKCSIVKWLVKIEYNPYEL